MTYAPFVFGLLLATSTAWAAEVVEVSAVKFSPNVRSPAGDAWYEADVALDVRPPPAAPGRMVSRVKVTLALQFDLPPAMVGGERRAEFYRAEAECVALGAGRAEVRFYLAPELVKRDQLSGDPRGWTVEVTAAGRAVPPARASAAPALAGAEARKNFQARIASAAPGNDGLLQPQFLTAFRDAYPQATPTFVRRESRPEAR
jgi:hypothetical protein